MSGGNPRLGEAQDWVFGIPQMAIEKNPDSGEEVAIDQIETTICANVADPSAPGGKRRVSLPRYSPVVVPVERAEQRRWLTTHACVSCVHFDLAKGQEEIKNQKVFERIIHEHNWKSRWFGVPKEMYGLCGDSGGTRLVSPAGTCDHFTPGRNKYNFFVSSGKKIASSIGQYIFKADRDKVR